MYDVHSYPSASSPKQVRDKHGDSTPTAYKDSVRLILRKTQHEASLSSEKSNPVNLANHKNPRSKFFQHLHNFLTS